MEIRVKLFATLRDRGPKGLAIGESFPISLKADSTVIDLLKHLGITVDEAKIVMRNHLTVYSYDEVLYENDEVAIFPPVGGGKIYLDSTNRPSKF